MGEISWRDFKLVQCFKPFCVEKKSASAVWTTKILQIFLKTKFFLNLVERFDRRRILHHRIGVRLILNFKAIGKIETFLELPSDLQYAILVVAVASPDGYKRNKLETRWGKWGENDSPILSPLARMFTTAPQMSSKLSNASPIKQRT